MDDIEITQLCAQAIGLEQYVLNGIPQVSSEHSIYIADKYQGRGYSHYDPLQNDAQTMALVKKFELAIAWSWAHQVSVMPKPIDDKPIEHRCTYTDLNRAICECIASMQKALP